MTVKSIKEIVEETVQYYSEDVNRRALIVKNSIGDKICKYITDDGKMCAVGRCIDESVIEQYKDNTCPVTYSMLNDFKQEYKVSNFCFWRDLQKLHDLDKYWNEDGISKEGRSWANSIIRFYS